MAVGVSDLVSQNARSIRGSEIRKILELTRSRDVISFAGGLPCSSVFPVDQIAECAEAILKKRGQLALQYGPTHGDKEYLDEVGKLTDRELAMGGDAAPDYGRENLLVSSGSQQALDLVAKLLVDPGDSILIGLPSYIGAFQVFGSLGVQFHGVKVDAEGISTDDLQSVLKRLSESGVRMPKLIYTVPDFQNPTGACLPEGRRRRLIELAEEFNFLIVEDCPYRHVRFEGHTIPSIVSLDGNERTICLHTFSKVMVPGLRLGWIVAAAELIDRLSVLKQAADLCTSSYNQAIAAEFCSRQYLDGHLQAVIALYREKRNRMLDALERHMPASGVTWSRPEGGMFLWLVLPENIDANQMLPQAIEHGVAYVVGDAFYADGSGKNTLRINFSFPNHDQIERGVERLGSLISSYL